MDRLLKVRKYVSDEYDKINDGTCYYCEPEDVFSNEPLALIQTEMLAIMRVLDDILKIIDEVD